MNLLFRRILVFTIVIFCLLGLSDLLFTTLMPKSKGIKQYWVLDKVHEQFDFAVLGNSRTFSGFDIGYFEKLSGLKGINLSIDGSSYPEQYLLLDLFLRKSEIKYLFLLADVYSVDNDFFSMPFHHYYYFPFISDSLTFDMLKEFYGIKAYFWKYIPFYRYASFNNVVGINTILKSFLADNNKLDERKGTFYNNSFLNRPEAEKHLSNLYPERKVLVNDSNIKYFRRILKLAERNGIKVIMINIPENEIVKPQQINRDQVLSYFKNQSQEYSIPYINEELNYLCSQDSLFANYTHLNAQGARKVTEAFYHNLKSEYWK